jgi:hypothetical protein
MPVKRCSRTVASNVGNYGERLKVAVPGPTQTSIERLSQQICERHKPTHTGQPVFSKAAVRTGANYLLGPAPPLLL